MIAAIHQPNFLPWIGYFHKIKNSDIFVFLDDVQFEQGKTFTSRTKIICSGAENWLTVPIKKKSELKDIKDTSVDDNFIWKKKHLKTLQLNYCKAPFFEEVFSILEKNYNTNGIYITDYNIPLITDICEYLNIKTQFICSSHIVQSNDLKGWDKILAIILELKADFYLSGSGAGSKRYVNADDLMKHNIRLEWQKYTTVEYAQVNNKGVFIPNLSIIDLLFNYGKEAINII
ncbi:MAG TPA: WbqC family protein [Bacteroidales bacterium]|nr:WbqC family protein [Bacteroidales bacterium]